MNIGYFDCFSGASGDMILGALVACGLDPDDLRSDLALLPVSGYTIEAREVRKQGFAAVKVEVTVGEEQPHRHLHHITDIIDGSSLPEPVRHQSKAIFTRLAEAEAAVHGTSIEKIHFHEVGAVDAIVDVVGAVCGVHRLGLSRITCSPIPTGSGTVTCQHGVMPVPAPATAELLKGVPLAECDESGELTTPTGAAILTTLSDSFGPLPAMRIRQTGYGAGTRDGRSRPNVLRLLIGEAAETTDEQDEVVVLEANLDDATGEQVGAAYDALFAAGALDVFTTPIAMKKNRPGVMLSVIVGWKDAAACETVLFDHTTTFGVRRHVCGRTKLSRESVAVETEFGTVRVKIGHRAGRVVRISPEFDDCLAAARQRDVPVREVMFAAERAWRASRGDET